MKKLILILAAVSIIAAAGFAQEAGTEISVFVPEALYLHNSGTVALTSGLGTSIGLGDYFEIPIGFDYCKVHGLMAEGVKTGGAAVTAEKPWFIADNFLPFVKLQANLPLGPVIITAFGGGALSWNATLTPLGSHIADDLAGPGEYAGFTELTASAPFGYGWLAGASFGVNIDAVTVSIFGEYRDITSPLTMTAKYSAGAAGDLTEQRTADASAAVLKMRGFACGIAGSFAF